MEGRITITVLFLVSIFGISIAYQCNERARKLGCFQDKRGKRLMRNEFTIRMKSSDWHGDKWNEHLDKLLCKCSEDAKKGGYLYFGLQHYYECWVGNLDQIDIETRRLTDESKCWSKNPKPFSCDGANEGQVCVGKRLTMSIYEVTYSSYVISETEEPTVKVMTLPNKGERPPPQIPVPPGYGH